MPFRWNQIWLLNITHVNRDVGGAFRYEIEAVAVNRGGFFVMEKLQTVFFIGGSLFQQRAALCIVAPTLRKNLGVQVYGRLS